MRRANERQAPIRTKAKTKGRAKDRQRRWRLIQRHRVPSPPVLGIALLEERRLAMDPVPFEANFARDVLGLSASHWHQLRRGAAVFGWSALHTILERFPELVEPMRRGAFGWPLEGSRPVDRLYPPSWVADELPELLVRRETELPLPE